MAGIEIVVPGGDFGGVLGQGGLSHDRAAGDQAEGGRAGDGVFHEGGAHGEFLSMGRICNQYSCD